MIHKGTHLATLEVGEGGVDTFTMRPAISSCCITDSVHLLTHGVLLFFVASLFWVGVDRIESSHMYIYTYTYAHISI